jgi:predicted HicB family RNase H-like nuclease
MPANNIDNINIQMKLDIKDVLTGLKVVKNSLTNFNKQVNKTTSSINKLKAPNLKINIDQKNSTGKIAQSLSSLTRSLSGFKTGLNNVLPTTTNLFSQLKNGIPTITKLGMEVYTVNKALKTLTFGTKAPFLGEMISGIKSLGKAFGKLMKETFQHNNAINDTSVKIKGLKSAFISSYEAIKKYTIGLGKSFKDMWNSIAGRDFKKTMGSIKSGVTSSLKGIGKSFKSVFSNSAFIKGAIGWSATLGASLVGLSLYMDDLRVETQNVVNQFMRLGGTTELLDNLRKATGHAVTDMKLMENVNLGQKLGVDIKNMAMYFQYASMVAKQTGQSIDYLVQSIVTGIGRKSKMILDNLGISWSRLNKELKRTSGDYDKAVFNIIQEDMKKWSIYTDDTTSSVEKLTAAWDNLKRAVAQSGFLKRIADIISTNSKIFIDQSMLNVKRPKLYDKDLKVNKKALQYYNVKELNLELQTALKRIDKLNKKYGGYGGVRMKAPIGEQMYYEKQLENAKEIKKYIDLITPKEKEAVGLLEKWGKTIEDNKKIIEAAKDPFSPEIEALRQENIELQRNIDFYWERFDALNKNLITIPKTNENISVSSDLDIVTDPKKAKEMQDEIDEINRLIGEYNALLSDGNWIWEQGAGIVADYKLEVLYLENELKKFDGIIIDAGPEPELFKGTIGQLRDYIKYYTELRDLSLEPERIDAYNKAIDALTDKLNKLTGTNDDATKSMMSFSVMVGNLATQAIDGISNMITDLASSIGETLVDGNVEIGKKFLTSFGNFLSNLGGMMVSFGALLVAYGAGLEALLKGDPTSKIVAGIILIGVGAALAGVGAAISKAAENPMNNSSMGTSVNCDFSSMYDSDRSTEFVIRGEDLVAVVNKSGNKIGYKY